MNFSDAYEQYKTLKTRLEAGELTPEAFQQAVQALRVTGSDGRLWQIDPAAGVWVPAPAPARPPAVTNLLVLALGLLALLAAAAACLALSGGLVWNLSRALPTRTASPTPPEMAATQTADALLLWEQTLTAQPTATVTPTLPPTETPTPTPTQVVALADPATATPELPGPWLVVSTGNSLYLVASGADRITTFNADPILGPADLSAAPAPNGGQIAYFTAQSPNQLEGLTLKIANLPDGSSAVEIPLAPAATVKDRISDLQTLFSPGNLAWSPDGRWLAFLSAEQNGVDVFVYHRESGATTRLSQEAGVEFGLAWSPDSRYLLYQTAASADPAETRTISLRAVQPENEAGTLLYERSGQTETVLGWDGSSAVLVYSRSETCPAYDLRRVKLVNGAVEPLFSGCFSSAARDPETGNVMFTVLPEQSKSCACGETLAAAGIYLLPAGQGAPRLVRLDDKALQVRWEPGTRQFFIAAAALTSPEPWMRAFTANGREVELQPAVKGVLPSVSAANGMAAWARLAPENRTGVWIAGPNQTPRRVFLNGAESPLWSPDGRYLFFFSKGQLYAAPAPDFTARLFDRVNSLKPQAVWVLR